MSVVITREDIISYAEVDYIIHHMNERYIQKLPELLVRFFAELKDPEHKVNINPYVPLQSQGLRKYTLEIIALLHLKYWCEDDKRKQELYDLMLRNQNKLEEQMKEKFSMENLFKNPSAKVVTGEDDLIEEDFSKPKKLNVVQVEKKPEENLPQEITNEGNENETFFSKFKRKILEFLHIK